MVNIGDSVTSQDGALQVTLTAFDPRRGEGRVKIEELKAERGRFYVTVEYGRVAHISISLPIPCLATPARHGAPQHPSYTFRFLPILCGGWTDSHY